MRAAAIGVPGLAVMYMGMAIFVVALLAARHGARKGPQTGGVRSSRSVLGIAVEALGFAAVGIGPVRIVLDPRSIMAMTVALAVALLMATAITLFVWATRTMGRNWSVVARTRDDHSLVETGPFAYCRHPIYTALFLMLVALALACGHTAQLLVGVPLYAIGTWLRVVEEERLLRAMFGDAYDRYAARVRRFVPRIGV